MVYFLVVDSRSVAAPQGIFVDLVPNVLALLVAVQVDRCGRFERLSS